MSRTSMPIRAISVLLAFVLTCTMFPATSLAFATEADGSAAAEASQDTVDTGESEDQNSATEEAAQDSAAANADQGDASKDGSAADAAAGDTSIDDAAAAPTVTSEDKPLKANAPEADDMLQVNVNLNSANTVLTSGNLTYTVNSDEKSVTLTGWTGSAPKGTLAIPAHIKMGNTAYEVTNIGSSEELGGGVRQF